MNVMIWFAGVVVLAALFGARKQVSGSSFCSRSSQQERRCFSVACTL